MIVGIDPGKTTAVACINLEGRVISIKCSSFVGFDWLVGQISNIGTPVIIASDKKESTALTNRLAATFGCRVFAPAEDLSTKKKDVMVKGTHINNTHERDALSAALSAYNAYANKFNQAEKIAKTINYPNIDDLKARIVKRYSMHETITNKKTGRR